MSRKPIRPEVLLKIRTAILRYFEKEDMLEATEMNLMKFCRNYGYSNADPVRIALSILICEGILGRIKTHSELPFLYVKNFGDKIQTTVKKGRTKVKNTVPTIRQEYNFYLDYEMYETLENFNPTLSQGVGNQFYKEEAV